MRVCPECRKSYSDDVETCPDDGMDLMASERLPENPELRDVVPVSPTDHTAMIDLDAIEAERERRGLNKPSTEIVEALPGDVDDDEPAHDPDATGTFHVDDLKAKERTQITSAGSLLADGDDEELEDDAEADARPARERTEVTRRPRGGEETAGKAAKRAREEAAAKARAQPGARGPAVIAGAVVAALLLAGGLAGGVWWYVTQRGAVLTVTSIPPGASVLVDGKAAGTAPLQERVTIGSHVIELSLEGYRPFKEVVDVPAEGLPFLQPLEEDPGARVAVAAEDGGVAQEAPAEDDAGETSGARASPEPTADEVIAEFDELLASRGFDAALEKIKELVRHYPEDKRAGDLFTRLADGRIKAATSTSSSQKVVRRTLSAEEKKREAREVYAAGEALYREGSYGEARAKFQSAIQLDPRYPQPHRAVARIFERDGNIEKTRYHLDRFLRLGGKDPDYRVRRWLEDHK